MTTYYVDPAAAGANNGTSWTNAWASLQSAADTAVAGDIVYCRGEEMISAKIDFDTNSGDQTNGFIKFIGCNASGNVDGTRFILNAGGTSGRHCIDASSGTADMVWMENIECKNSTGTSYGFSGSTNSIGWVFINCCANNTGSEGFRTFGNGTVAFRCVAYSCGSNGFYRVCAKLLFCTARDNTGSGFEQNLTGSCFYGCISHGNGDDGIELIHQNSIVINSVIDGNTDDGIIINTHTDLYPLYIIGNRVTNHSTAGSIALNCGSEPVVTGWNYFEDNDGNNIQNDTLHYAIPLEGTATTSNAEDQADTDEGYVDKANHDFSTRYVDGTDPTLRRTAITVPWS